MGGGLTTTAFFLYSVPRRNGVIMCIRTGTVLGVIVGILAGYTAMGRTSQAAAVRQMLVDGDGRASTSVRPPGEPFLLHVRTPPLQSFTIIPRDKKFILTDVMYIAQGSLRQEIAVNIASANPLRQSHDILFQVRISPGESDDVHLCSGYVIPSGHSLTAFSNAGPEPNQFVSVAVTGYLADE
jgi:hypothetical protein